MTHWHGFSLFHSIFALNFYNQDSLKPGIKIYKEGSNVSKKQKKWKKVFLAAELVRER